MSDSNNTESTQSVTATITESVSVSVSVKNETPTYRSDTTSITSTKKSEISEDEEDSQKTETHLTLNEITFSDDSDDDRNVKPVIMPEATLFGDISNGNEMEEEELKYNIKKEQLELSDDSDEEEEKLEGIVMADPDELEGHYQDEENDDKEVVHDVQLSTGRVNLEYSEKEPYFVRFPNFLSVATAPFEENEYEADEVTSEKDKLKDEGNSRLKLKVENTIRWRMGTNENGQQVPESNAKIVKWDDGSMSLYLGNEIFEINQMVFNKNYRPHLYVQQPGIMSAQSVMTHRMTFRPHSTESKTHRKVTLKMADRSRSRKNLLITEDLGVNPEIARKENVRKEEEAMRKHIRKTHNIRNSFKLRRSNYYGGSNSDEDMPRMRRKKEPSIIGGSDDEEGPSKRSGSDSDSDEEYRKKKLNQKKHIVTSDEEEIVD